MFTNRMVEPFLTFSGHLKMTNFVYFTRWFLDNFCTFFKMPAKPVKSTFLGNWIFSKRAKISIFWKKSLWSFFFNFVYLQENLKFCTQLTKNPEEIQVLIPEIQYWIFLDYSILFFVKVYFGFLAFLGSKSGKMGKISEYLHKLSFLVYQARFWVFFLSIQKSKLFDLLCFTNFWWFFIMIYYRTACFCLFFKYCVSNFFRVSSYYNVSYSCRLLPKPLRV